MFFFFTEPKLSVKYGSSCNITGNIWIFFSVNDKNKCTDYLEKKPKPKPPSEVSLNPLRTVEQEVGELT